MTVKLTRGDMAKLALEQLKSDALAAVDKAQELVDTARTALHNVATARAREVEGMQAICKSMGIQPSELHADLRLGTAGDWMGDSLPSHLEVVLRDGPPASCRIMLRMRLPMFGTVQEAAKGYRDALLERSAAQVAMDRLSAKDAQIAMINHMLKDSIAGVQVVEALRKFNKWMRTR